MSVFKKTISTIEPIKSASLEEIVRQASGYDYCIVWRLSGVNIYGKGSFVSDSVTDILELRAFNENEELKATKVGESFVCRKRTDGNGETTEYVDETHKLWGSEYGGKLEGDYVLLTEDRGTEVKIPASAGIPGQTQYMFVDVRNYVSREDEDFEFVDWRFVKFHVEEAEKSYE